MNSIIKKVIQYTWRLRSRLYLDFPIPCFLPYGSLYLAYGDGMGLQFFFRRPFEENEWRFVFKFLKPGMVFFDVGANQGFYTLLAAKQVGQMGKVFSFEPIESQIRKLKKNIKINRLKNTIVEQLAIGSKSGTANMYVCLNGDEAMSSLREPYKDASSNREIIQVSLCSIDDYIKKHDLKSVDFIKIDIEGGELEALKGAVNAIKEFQPVFMCEVQNIRTGQWGYKASDICDFLQDNGYSLFVPNQNGFLEPIASIEECELKKVSLIATPPNYRPLAK